MTKQHILKTRTFGKAARKQVLEIIGAYKFKKAGYKTYKLVNAQNEMIGHVEEAAWDGNSAILFVK